MSMHQVALPPYPAVGEIFELTLDGDTPENRPLVILERDGYTSTWQYDGPLVQGRQTRRFMFVQVGYQPNLEAVLTALAAHGAIPEGQWREALKATYRPDGQGPVGVAVSSWRGPDGRANFPYVRSDGKSLFHWADLDYGEYWRWLVVVS